MNLRLTHFAAATAILFAGASAAMANPVTWVIDSTASKFALKIPDQVINVSGTTYSLRVRNETGSSTTWNVGNTAAVAGTLDTDYYDGTAGPRQVQFLNSGGTAVGVNSGLYRPNPATYTGGTTLPNGVQSGGNFSSSTANFGAVFASKAAVVVIFQIDAAYLDFWNVHYDMNSALLTVAGTSVPTNAGTTNVGIQHSLISADGLSILGTQPIPDGTFALDNALGLIGAASGAGALTNTGALTRKLVIPMIGAISIDLGNNSFLTGISSGTLTMNATVPEPSTLMLVGIGLVSLAVCARRKLLGR